MFASLRTPLLAIGAALSLSACGGYYGTGVSVGYNGGYGYDDGYYDDGYGYADGYGYGYGSSAYDVYGDPYFSGRYGYSPAYGWYNNYFYPGTGYYVYDRRGTRYSYNDDQRRFWERNRFNIRDREDLRDVRRYSRDQRQDRREFVRERRDDRRAVRDGTVTRDQFRADRRGDRQQFRQERRQDRRALRQDLRDGGARAGGGDRARFREIRQQVRENRAVRRNRGN